MCVCVCVCVRERERRFSRLGIVLVYRSENVSACKGLITAYCPHSLNRTGYLVLIRLLYEPCSQGLVTWEQNEANVHNSIP